MTHRGPGPEEGGGWRDISVAVHPDRTPLWPGSPPVRLDRRLSLERGDPVNDTTLRCSVHTGTHVDAPAHHLPGGATIESLAHEVLVGPCVVVDLGGLETVDRSDLEERVECTPRRLLLKTDNSTRWSPRFREDFTGLTVEAARWTVEQGVALLGIDYLSVQPYGGSDEVHRLLLGAEVVLLEGVDLSGIAPGAYELVCLPVKLAGAEAAPARALLRPLDGPDAPERRRGA